MTHAVEDMDYFSVAENAAEALDYNYVCIFDTSAESLLKGRDNGLHSSRAEEIKNRTLCLRC